MELTRNFTLSELTKSDTAIRKGINNNPNAEQIEKLKTLCEKILQPVRDHFGRVKVTSGFRSPELCVALSLHHKSCIYKIVWLVLLMVCTPHMLDIYH